MADYGVDDASYQAAGGLEGITKLVDDFYRNMETLPEAKEILAMHSDNLSESRMKLSYFLSGWLGGPKLYSQNFGPIKIPKAHSHLDVGVKERDAWLYCMSKAIAIQSFDESFKSYLLEQLKVPAERIRLACER